MEGPDGEDNNWGGEDGNSLSENCGVIPRIASTLFRGIERLQRKMRERHDASAKGREGKEGKEGKEAAAGGGGDGPGGGGDGAAAGGGGGGLSSWEAACKAGKDKDKAAKAAADRAAAGEGEEADVDGGAGGGAGAGKRRGGAGVSELEKLALSEKHTAPSRLEVQLKVAMVEIYMEVIRDLLADEEEEQPRGGLKVHCPSHPTPRLLLSQLLRCTG